LKPTNNSGLCESLRPTAIIRIRDTHIAVKRERTIPRPSINPNPLISDIPKIYRIIAEVSDVI
jgi:hypothetical protein